MNSPSSSGLENSKTPKNISPIVVGYDQGLKKFEELLRGTYNETDATSKEVYTTKGEALRKDAINDCLGSLEHTGTVQEQLLKIDSLLLLVKLTPQEDISTREEYFGRAMRVALQYLGSDMWKEGHKGEVWAGKIRGAYTNDINKNVKPEYASDPNHMNFMHSHITKIALDKRKDILETAARTAEYLEDISDYSEIIGKIEQAFGPCRLLIISEESSTILTSHRVDPIVVDTMLRQSRDYGYTIAVKTFEGKVRYYTIVIDRGTSEKLNQLKPEHLETIINPILKRHIQVKEDSFVTFVREYDASVVECEKNMRVPLIRPDYSEFISSVIEQSSDPGVAHELREDPDYIVHAIQAIDICRAITLARGTSELPQYIDTILGGKINTKVLSMVKAILLSRNETMSGSGYPFGLSRANIPLIAKLYQIVRLYEAKSSIIGDRKILMEHLTECNKGGYMDPDIFEIFYSAIIKNQPPIVPLKPRDTRVTPYRSAHYTHCLDRFFGLVELITEIKDAYKQYYTAKNDTDIQKKNFLIISELQRRIRELDDNIKLFLIMRHPQALSDMIKGSPGDDHEPLTKEGEKASSQIGEDLAGLNLRIIASPLERATQAARIIVDTMSAIIKDLLQKNSIIIEKSFNNPRKNGINGRYDSLLAKLVEDDTSTLRSFLTDLVSSSQQWIHLFIVHRDSGRSLMLFLLNMFEDKRIRGTKMPFNNNDIYEIVFRGDHVLEGEELKDRGLLFSRTDWKQTIAAVNTITQEVFGDAFYHIDHPVNLITLIDHPVNLITLHGQFLDYIHLKNETAPESISTFVRQFDSHPLTRHFSRILRYESLISDSPQ